MIKAHAYGDVLVAMQERLVAYKVDVININCKFANLTHSQN